MSKRTLVIVGIAAAALVGLGILVVILVGILGGTPIIIKGFGDPAGDLAIEGSPTADKPTTGPESHARLDSITQLYVLDSAHGTCVIYVFEKPATPSITIDVKGSPGEIDLRYSVPPPNTHPVVDLKFDEDTYSYQSGGVYKRKQAGSIERVNIVSDPNTTACTDKAGTPIKPCPTQFSSLGQVTVAVNYTGQPCQ